MYNSIESYPDDLLINEILPKIERKQLGKLCVGNRKIALLCQNEAVWRNRVQLEYADAINNKPDQITWYQYYRYLLNTIRIPILVDHTYIGSLRIDLNDLGSTIEYLLEILKVKHDEIISFIFLNNINPVAVYNYPEDKWEYNNTGQNPDRLYIKKEQVTKKDEPIYPFIYMLRDLKMKIGTQVTQCQITDRFLILSIFYRLGVPTRDIPTTGDTLSQFPKEMQAKLAKEPEEKLRYYATWNRYTSLQLCEILYDYLKKTGRTIE